MKLSIWLKQTVFIYISVQISPTFFYPYISIPQGVISFNSFQFHTHEAMQANYVLYMIVKYDVFIDVTNQKLTKKWKKHWTEISHHPGWFPFLRQRAPQHTARELECFILQHNYICIYKQKSCCLSFVLANFRGLRPFLQASRLRH